MLLPTAASKKPSSANFVFVDEDLEFFRVLLEYCRKGKATYKPVDRLEMLSPRKGSSAGELY